MADYSATPLARKLGMMDGHAIQFIGAPSGFLDALEPLPDVRVRRRGAPGTDVIVCFTTTASDLTRRLRDLPARLAPAGGLWIAWPKRSSPLARDLDFGTVQEAGLATGLVDNKSCTIDDDWQALRFVRRVADRGTSA